MRLANYLPRTFSAGARRALIVVTFLLVASCSGGGCSSGCSSCGTAPLPGGFPKNETIPNAASLRVTRSGLDFVQENLTGLAAKAIGTGTTGGVATFDVPKTSMTGAEICTPAKPKPPECQAEIDLGNAKVRINAITPNRVKIDGTLPVRIRNLPVKLVGFVNGYVVAGDPSQAPGGDLCAVTQGAPTFPYKAVPINIELPLVEATKIPRNGYTKVDVDHAVIDIGIDKDDVAICVSGCSGFCATILDGVKDFAFNSLIGGIEDQIKTGLSGAFCTAPAPTVTPPCPTGSEPDNADLSKATKCVFAGTKECVPSLLGLDGRMDLSKALAAYSPGTTGGLDFVLASAGDMNPAPGETTVPAWTPRNPPVPAEDNNKNGISLSMLGGTLPHPESNCVSVVPNSPPRDIPVPKELLGDTISPWPAGAAGPHLGVAIAGRFLTHAATSAYNSGLLCLGVSTEQVDQLSSGTLSLLAPSIKTLAFEQNPAAAAITTRPGTPPKITLGGGTDVNADPLLTIALEKFSIDFYVWSHDRFVRAFTYTADITVPVNLQTGKDPKTNPNGGLLPVLGDLRLANASVTNTELLFEDPAQISGGITGLLGGLVGQFLGGGFSPIDLSSALQSYGLGLEIPEGGIRKLTSGKDDFLGLFVNLTKTSGTAHEEADTRAEIVAKEVHPEAMSLETATRALFPKLRVHAEGLATRPTEQTWWVDDGPHAAWTTSQDLLVDADAMLLQGKHVLHVSSRVVGETASEDGTPVAIPFTIDTLAPSVHAEREGDRVEVRARDFVSDEGALVARRRVDAGAWTDWVALSDMSAFDAPAASEVDVEVRDEEGNVGRVSLPLIRGRADSTLAAASGCSCRTTGAGGSGSGAWALAMALGLALTAVRRRRA